MVESASFLLLLLAMVVKYGFDEPAGVEVMGPLHGVLFLLYIGGVLLVWKELKWSARKGIAMLLAGVIPVAGYIVGHRILKDEAIPETVTA
jgi:integral membrane protein